MFSCSGEKCSWESSVPSKPGLQSCTSSPCSECVFTWDSLSLSLCSLFWTLEVKRVPVCSSVLKYSWGVVRLCVGWILPPLSGDLSYLSLKQDGCFQARLTAGRLCLWTVPSTASTTKMQPSQMRTTLDSSEERSTCLGESIRFIRYSSLLSA